MIVKCTHISTQKFGAINNYSTVFFSLAHKQCTINPSSGNSRTQTFSFRHHAERFPEILAIKSEMIWAAEAWIISSRIKVHDETEIKRVVLFS